MIDQPYAAADAERARLCQVAAEERAVTIRNLERHIQAQRDDRIREVQFSNNYMQELFDRCRSLESRSWILLQLLLLQTLVFAAVCTWLYWRR